MRFKKVGMLRFNSSFIEMIEVTVPKSEVDDFLKNGGKVLNAKMLFKRKHEIVDVSSDLRN